jgi:hypothetical protein
MNDSDQRGKGMSRDWHRVHGVSSILLFAVAVAVADTVLFRISLGLGLSYVGVAVAGLLGIVTSFCTQCCCKHQCSHVALGWIAQWLPARPVGKYQRRDLIGVIASFAAIAIFPQFWLWTQPLMGVLFWALTAAIVLEIARGVCPSCRNVLCPFHSQASSVPERIGGRE